MDGNRAKMKGMKKLRRCKQRTQHSLIHMGHAVHKKGIAEISQILSALWQFVIRMSVLIPPESLPCGHQQLPAPYRIFFTLLIYKSTKCINSTHVDILQQHEQMRYIFPSFTMRYACPPPTSFFLLCFFSASSYPMTITPCPESQARNRIHTIRAQGTRKRNEICRVL